MARQLKTISHEQTVRYSHALDRLHDRLVNAGFINKPDSLMFDFLVQFDKGSTLLFTQFEEWVDGMIDEQLAADRANE